MVIAPEALHALSIDSDPWPHDDFASVKMEMDFLHRELEPCFDPFFFFLFDPAEGFFYLREMFLLKIFVCGTHRMVSTKN
ncbi:hypothetical protein AHAS_Ahas20G0226500 [Arachis hypogaea]